MSNLSKVQSFPAVIVGMACDGNRDTFLEHPVFPSPHFVFLSRSVSSHLTARLLTNAVVPLHRSYSGDARLYFTVM